jgi:phosphatidylserine decarboxylase
LLSIRRSNNPAFDSSGGNADINQFDPHVFFLCQTWKGIRSIDNRTISVKDDKSILMPVINWISILHIDGETDEELIAVVKKRMDVVSKLEITIDGLTINEGLERYRTLSPFFNILTPKENILELPAGPTRT